ncbi:MAG: hypothetical protein AB2L24_11600 [Mangrovibacterium sp.]
MQRVFLEGMTIDELLTMIRKIIREEIQKAENDKTRPVSKSEACRHLNINYRTIIKIMKKEGMTEIYNTDIPKLKLKYHKSSQRISLKR